MGFFSDMFGGNTGAGDAEKKYMQYMQQALANLQGHEATGRSDITGALKQGLGFQQPYMEAGKSALGAYMGSMGLPGGSPGGQQGAVDRFTQSPGYQYALNQGLSAASRGAAAAGLSGSGAAQKELQQRGQGMANQEFGQYQGRLAGLAGMGQHASDVSSQMAYGTGGELSQQGLGYAGQETGVYGNMGQAAAEAEMAKAAGKNTMWGNIGNFAGTLGGMVSGMFGGGASGASSGGGANDPFAGGGSPTNPYTGAPYPGGAGGAAGAAGGAQGQQGFSLMQLLPFLMAIL